MVLQIDDFFTDEECDRYVTMSLSDKKQVMESRSPTVGKDANAKAQRTSTTWYHHYKGVPELMSKASRLLGLDGIDHWEEPQTVRYRRNEKFTWHVDALGPDESKMDLSGQRTVTLILYLAHWQENEGGAIPYFGIWVVRVSGEPLCVQARKGSALLFFPAAGGIPLAPLTLEARNMVKLSGRTLAKTSGSRSCGYGKASTLLPRLMEISIRRRQMLFPTIALVTKAS
jgi:predicted 2-oxoglutarate/Fe(II)-dependent dioxygenase YbiX